MSVKEKNDFNKVKRVLSDTFVLYMKTYAVHWNFTGPNFFSVHKLTEGQYQELAEAVDEIAERLKAMGYEAPISLEDILAASDLKEITSSKMSPSSMIEDLARSHDLLAKRAKEAAETAEESKDHFTHDMMVARIGAHEKAAWMIKSLLKN